MQILLFSTLLCYSMVVSQSFMYTIALADVQKRMGASAYIGFRKLLDAKFKARYPYVMYATFGSNLFLSIHLAMTPATFLFWGSFVSFLALVADILLAVKGNIPLNKLIDTWTPTYYPPHWNRTRDRWLHIFHYRQWANVTGFTTLLAVAIFR